MSNGIGVPTSGIEYRKSLNIASKDCRNCTHCKPRVNPKSGSRYIWCTGFNICITDTKNARHCRTFVNKHPENQIRKATQQRKRQRNR